MDSSHTHPHTPLDQAVRPMMPATRIADWSWVVQPGRPNGLLVGHAEVTSEVLEAIEPVLLRPIVHWPHDRAPWRSEGHPATVVLHDILALGPTDQEALVTWMDVAPHRVQIISVASGPVYPLVEDGRFLATLYYRLNCVYVEC